MWSFQWWIPTQQWYSEKFYGERSIGCIQAVSTPSRPRKAIIHSQDLTRLLHWSKLQLHPSFGPCSSCGNYSSCDNHSSCGNHSSCELSSSCEHHSSYKTTIQAVNINQAVVTSQAGIYDYAATTVSMLQTTAKLRLAVKLWPSDCLWPPYKPWAPSIAGTIQAVAIILDLATLQTAATIYVSCGS